MRRLLIPPLAATWAILAAASGAGAATPEDAARLQGMKGLAAAIDTTQAEHGPFSPLLRDPVMALARMKMADGDHEAARDLLRRAQNIDHRNEGVHTPSQLEAVQLLTDMALAEGDFDTANQQQEFAFFTRRHHLGPGSLESFGAHLDLADWYLSTGQPRLARRLLSDAGEIARSADERIHLAVLNEKARRLQGLCCGAKQLRQAIESVVGEGAEEEDVEKSASADSLAEIHLSYGDSLLLARKKQEAAEQYRKAAAINPLYGNQPARPISAKRIIKSPLQAQVETFRLRKDPYGRLTRLQRMSPTERLEDDHQPPQWYIFDGEGEHLGFKAPDPQATAIDERKTQVLVGDPLKFEQDQLNFILPTSLRREAARAALSVELSFTVETSGNLSDIEIVESNAPAKVNRLLVAALKKAFFRPAMENGTPVAQSGVGIVQTFNSYAGNNQTGGGDQDDGEAEP